MKARNLFIACTSIVVSGMASPDFAWAAFSCTTGEELIEAGTPSVPCNRKSDGRQLGYGSVNDNVLTVSRVGLGRDLTIFGYDDGGDYIEGCYAQTLVGATDPTVFFDDCSEDVGYFSIVGKDMSTF